MKITRQARSDAKALLRACRVDGVLDERRVREVVARVLGGKPRGYMGILQGFAHLVKVDLDRRTAVVESATPLAIEFQKQISANLGSRHGTDLLLAFHVVPGLIGGLRVRVGSNIYDGTIAGRLELLKEKF